MNSDEFNVFEKMLLLALCDTAISVYCIYKDIVEKQIELDDKKE